MDLKKITDFAVSSLDAANMCLTYYSLNPSSTPSQKQIPTLKEFRKIINYAGMYQTIEDFFYYILWLDWQIKEDKIWLLFPKNIEHEQRWQTSWIRFEQLLVEVTGYTSNLWQNSFQFRHKWLHSYGTPNFQVKERKHFWSIQYLGHKTSSQDVPTSMIKEVIVREFYYLPLLNTPIPGLNDKTVSELLKVTFFIGEIAEQISHSLPKRLAITRTKELLDFFPTVREADLIKSLALATGIPEGSILQILEILTWKPKKNLWFHPLLKVNKNSCIHFQLALLPLISPNPYRVVDYWLSDFGLPLEQRGHLFEKQIFEMVKGAANSNKFSDCIHVISSRKWDSYDKTSTEEIDIIIVMHNLIVIGEAKCQKLPETPLDRKNYIETLSHASVQATRKAEWVRRNFNIITSALQIDINILSGEVCPIVISNHAVGAGLTFHDVPVLDLPLLCNYFEKPFVSSGHFSSGKLEEYQRGTCFYNSPSSMAAYFKEYSLNPPFLEEYKQIIKSEFVPCIPSVRRSLVIYEKCLNFVKFFQRANLNYTNRGCIISETEIALMLQFYVNTELAEQRLANIASQIENKQETQ